MFLLADLTEESNRTCRNSSGTGVREQVIRVLSKLRERDQRYDRELHGELCV